MERYEIFNTEEFSKAQESKEYLEGFLEGIDFDKLHMILSDVCKAAGKEDVNLLGKEDFLTEYEDTDPDKDYAGSYSPDVNKAYISVEFTKGSKDEYRNFEFIHTLVHESIHALAKKVCTTPKEHESAGFNQMGRHLIKDGNGSIVHFFEYFDEAVTEKMARELFRKYITTGENKEEYTKILDEKENLLSYQPYVEFLNQFIDNLSDKTGVSTEVVWQGIVNDYLQGFNLFDSELEKAFEDIFYEGVIQDIALIDDPKDLQSILERIKTEYNTGLMEKIVYRVERKINGIKNAPQ